MESKFKMTLLTHPIENKEESEQKIIKNELKCRTSKEVSEMFPYNPVYAAFDRLNALKA